MSQSKFIGGLMGAFVGDAVGVPYEFISRRNMRKKPCVDMVGYGTHMQPRGSWSDDSTMIYASMDALLKDQAYHPVTFMDNFLAWMTEGAFTPFNEVFDMGVSTGFAINKYSELKKIRSAEFAALNSGYSDERSNGNGSLMRMMPVSLYSLGMSKPEAYQLACDVSALTHAHAISRQACAFFTLLIHHLKEFGTDVCQALATTQADYVRISKELGYAIPQDVRKTLLERDLKQRPAEGFRSKGYVLGTLEMAIWAMLNFTDYKQAILAVVNEGHDTDTNACVTGALLGYIYGEEAIPADWKAGLVNHAMVSAVMHDFYHFCGLDTQQNFELL